MEPKHRKIIDLIVTTVLTGLLLWGFWSFLRGQVVFDLFTNNPERFKDYLVGFGAWSQFVYVCLVILEILFAFIPGWFIYPAGGAVFGVWETIGLILIANFIGGSICFWIGYRWGVKLLEKFISPKYIDRFNRYMEKNGSLAVFLLKINPITSYDLWNYVAGASPMGFWKFTLANLFGVAPLVAVVVALGEEGYKIAPQLLGVLFLVTVFYIVWFFVNLPEKIRKAKSK